LHYHGQNETILINDGYITWRYWLRRVKEVDCARPGPSSEGPDSSKEHGGRGGAGEGQRGGAKGSDDLPCRVVLKSRGLQWFLYNRSPAYDAILKNMSGGDMNDQTSEDEHYKQKARLNKTNQVPVDSRRSPSSSIDNENEIYEKLNGDIDRKVPYPVNTGGSSHIPASTLPSILTILPIKVECIKGAIVMGNQNTRSILITRFQTVVGYVNARSSRTVDQYKQCIDLDFVHPVIQLKPNRDFKEAQLVAGAQVKSDNARGLASQTPWRMLTAWRQRIHKTWSSLRELTLYGRSSVESLSQDRSKTSPKTPIDTAGMPGQHRWLGLTRYLDDDDDMVEQERWKAIEYGAVSTVIDSPKVAVSVYWDVPGLVPNPGDKHYSTLPKFTSDINGDVPPDWGVELRVGGGTISYGPWTDRQRADLQNVFFPTLYRDTIPAVRLKPGQSRVSTVFKFVLEVEEETSLQIPTREESKDWKWKDQAINGNEPATKKRGKMGYVKKRKGQKAVPTPDTRPFGWLDVKLLPDSTVSFMMDLVASSSGYKSRVDIDLKGLEMSSSVNHGLLWRSKSQVISCDLCYPLGWNTLRQWQFEVQGDALELFLLRDHIFLITDLINDWASGPPSDFHTFVPFDYAIRLRFSNFRLYINANDSNIIDNPSDVNDNTFVVVWGETLNAELDIPLNKFRPIRNRITFDINASNGGFELRTPLWNTQHAFLDNANVAALKHLIIDGSYNYFTSTSPTLTDIVLLNVHGISPEIHLYGFLIRYLMKIKDNYFGEDLHFRTLEEYQRQVAQKELYPESVIIIPPSKLSNDLDVILSIAAENTGVLLPAHLYSAAESLRLDISSISGDLRFTNYYMDLAVSFSPVAVSRTVAIEHLSSGSTADSSTQVFVDGLEIYGHRLFGLPPLEPTYVCNWDFNVGSITGECSTGFLRSLMLALRCFTFSFGDGENALPPLHPPVVHDVTFLRARLRPVSVWIPIHEKALLFSTSEIKFDYNDWADPPFSERFYVSVPDMRFIIMEIVAHSGDRSRKHPPATTHAYFEATLLLRMVKQKLESSKDCILQQSHVSIHDARTHRTNWLIHDADHVSSMRHSSRPTKVRPPAMPFPTMPEPVSDGNNAIVDRTSLSSSSIQTISSRRSSFLVKVSKRQMNVRRRAGKGSPDHITQPRFSNKLPQSTIPNSRVPETSQSQNLPPCEPACQSSYGNQLGELANERNIAANLGFAFSSPYKRPYFSLHGITPHVSDVPILPDDLPSDNVIIDASESIDSRLSAQDVEQSSFLLHFSRGLRAFFTPEASTEVPVLLGQLQPLDTVGLLDTLQIEAIAGVLKSVKKRSNGRKVTEVRAFMPYLHARFLNNSISGSSDLMRREQLDLTIEKFTATARSNVNFPIQTENTTDQQLCHIILDRISCSAKDLAGDPSQDQAMIQLTIDDLVLWISSGIRASADLRFSDLDISSAGRTVDHISSLVRQAALLSRETLRKLPNITREHALRIRMLVLSLTTDWDSIPDPPFLTRASYVLRSATSHLRTSDSWKMLSRLRYVYQSLSSRSQAQMFEEFAQARKPFPEDAKNRVITSFEHWRVLDVAHVKQSQLIRNVFGDSKNPAHGYTLARMPLEISIRGGGIQLLLHPGPNQNQIAIDRLVVSVAMNEQRNSISDGSHQDDSKALNSMIEMRCAQSVVSLNWDICKLLEDVVRYLQASKKSTPAQSNDDPLVKTSNETHSVHWTALSETAMVSLNSINLKATTVCEGLNASLLVSDIQDRPEGSTASLLVNARTTTSEVQSHSRILTQFKLHIPSIFGSNNIQLGDESGARKLATSCSELSFTILEHPLELLEVADLLLKDEVAYVKTFAQTLQPTSNRRTSPTFPSQPVDLGEFHVALLLDSYIVSFAVLPSLTYKLAGQGVRSSIQSGVYQESKIVVDFDVKDHAHTFASQANDASDEISTMHMPPSNGRLTLDLRSTQKYVIFHCMVEGIVLDASAVHALLVIMNRPEFSSLAASIHREFDLVRDHYEELVPFQPQVQAEHQAQILYSAYVTWAGLTVSASTSNANASPGGTQLRFDLGCFQLKATNRDSDHRQASRYPELELKVKGMEMNLTRPDIFELRSCGDIGIEAIFKCTSEVDATGNLIQAYHVRSTNFEINLYAETVSAALEILTHLQNRLKSIDLSNEVKSLRKHRRATLRSEAIVPDNLSTENDAVSSFLSSAVYSLEMAAVRVCWKIGNSTPTSPGREAEDLVLSFTKIDLATKRDNAARLLMQDFQLQMVPISGARSTRSLNSALLPEVVFKVAYLSTTKDRRLAFQAAGKSLDIRLTPQFILPATALRRSIAVAVTDLRAAKHTTQTATSIRTGNQTQNLFIHKKLASLLIDADFAGAVVYIQGQNVSDSGPQALNALQGGKPPQRGRYGQFTSQDAGSSTTLRAPGIALKVEYKDASVDKPSLNAEFKVDASSNILYPSVVPLIMEVSSSVKEIVGESDNQEQPLEPKLSTPKFLSEGTLRTANPSAILGNCTLNLGLRICRQEFSLSCQPVARVAATAHFDDIYITVNTVQSADYGQFFTLSAAFTRLQASVQHVYSRESTASFDVDSIVLSLMNSKHVSAANGISAILKVSPMKALVNAKQMQDFLLFREIWIPPEIRHSPDASAPTPSTEPQAFIVERYQQVAAAGAFPWNATVSIAELDVQLDLGQSLGESVFIISNFWISSKKTSDWEQNLCLGFEKVGVDSKGRMSGFVALQNFRVRTSIQWPITQQAQKHTPLIQASLGFDHLRIKAAFDFQAFLVADITSLSFLMYNVRDTRQARGDRLVGVVDGDKVQIFCITTSVSQGLALYQAVQRLIQEKQAAYETSLKDIEKYLRRKSSIRPLTMQAAAKREAEESQKTARAPLQLQTNVVVTLKAVNIGTFPSTFFDNQIFKLEALDASARFAVKLDHGRIHSDLGMTLGQLRIALSGITRSTAPKTLREVSVDDVVSYATGSRGGTILKVPKLVATMQTWQSPESTHIDYIFKSSFQGKVDVGWNYSRIGFLRGMWASHNRALAQRLGKPIPQSALQITGGPQPKGEGEGEGEDDGQKHGEGGQEKITAVVYVPQSKYQYKALQPAIIETPQLRDMGEATPPLEWIGLHRDRLPNLTHQIVIVTLLEVAKEVEDAYSKILGSS